MAKRPLARRHLARLHDLVSTASICRANEERIDSSIVADAAAGDRSMAEEVLALARERGWELPTPKPYSWQLMATFSDVRPRIMRVIKRDIFELDGIYRETDDDDVASLAGELRARRRALVDALTQEEPRLNLPGAK